MPDNVIEIGNFRAQRLGRHEPGNCPHRSIVLDPNGDVVTCEDCKKQISAFSALWMLMREWEDAWAKVKEQRADIHEAEARTLILRAAQHVERAWRSRSMVPTCPHCCRGIFPHDGFGSSAVDKQIEVRRRKVERENRTDGGPDDQQRPLIRKIAAEWEREFERQHLSAVFGWLGAPTLAERYGAMMEAGVYTPKPLGRITGCVLSDEQR